MLHRGNLQELDTHVQRASRDLGQACFLVGGSVRDVLCGWTMDPTDIDVTCAGDPHILYAALEKRASEFQGLFRTEKYGTMTWLASYGVDDGGGELRPVLPLEAGGMLHTDEIDVERPVSNSELSGRAKRVAHTYTYECTPFRTEGVYTDARHPDQVQRTNSLLADARRRDFTVNAMYYTIVGTPAASVGSSLIVDEQQITRQLEKQGWTYIVGVSLLVVQSEELIDRLTTGVMTRDVLQAFFADMQVPLDCTQGVRVLFDPAKGIADILIRKLRTVGDPDQRFAEDSLRILRAARFVNIWNQHHGIQFDFHKDTWTSMQKNAGLVTGLAKERLHDELVKVFKKRNPFGYIAILDELDLLKTLFPTLYRCKHNDQPIRYHPFDTYAHTMLTLWHLQQINDHYLVKLAMLYHDVGKPDQYAAYAAAETPEARAAIHGSPLNHAISGQVFVHNEFAALGFSSAEMEEIAWYVGMHMRPGQILEAASENQRKKLRLLYSEAGYERVRNLLDVTVADRRGQFNPIQRTEIDAVDALYTMLDDLRDTEGQFTMRELAVNGSDIMEHFQLAPGPHIGKLLGFAFQWVIHEKEARNKKTSILSFLKGCIQSVSSSIDDPISSMGHDGN